MEPFFSEEQLNNMSRENLIELMKIMKDQTVKKDQIAIQHKADSGVFCFEQ